MSPPPHTTHSPYVHSYARTHDTHRPTTQNTQAPHNPPLPDPLHIHILTMPIREGFLPPSPDILAPSTPNRAAPTYIDSPKPLHTARSDSTHTPIPYTYPHNNTLLHAQAAAHPLLHALPPKTARKTHPRPPYKTPTHGPSTRPILIYLAQLVTDTMTLPSHPLPHTTHTRKHRNRMAHTENGNGPYNTRSRPTTPPPTDSHLHYPDLNHPLKTPRTHSHTLNPRTGSHETQSPQSTLTTRSRAPSLTYYHPTQSAPAALPARRAWREVAVTCLSLCLITLTQTPPLPAPPYTTHYTIHAPHTQAHPETHTRSHPDSYCPTLPLPSP